MSMRSAPSLLFLALLAAACSDPSQPPRPARAEAASAVVQDVPAGTAVPVPPSVRVTTTSGRPVAGVRVTFSLQEGGGTITGTEPVTDETGTARLGSWVLGTVPGVNSVRAAVAELPGVQVTFQAVALPAGCSRLVIVDDSDDFLRLRAGATTFPCLLLDAAQTAGREYLLLFENMAPTGGFSTALFPGPLGDTAFAFTLQVEPLAAAGAVAEAAPPVALHASPADPGADHAWDFGDGRLREHHPEPMSGTAGAPGLVRGSRIVDLASVTADPAVGDTIQVLMEALPRLAIDREHQQAVIRFISDDLIIAEDVRLSTTLVRPGGGFNSPIPDADLASIAAEYAAAARVQGDIFFQSRHNSAVEATVPRRVIAVHSLMPADDIWGYTYSTTNYLVWDYWVGTNGSTRGLNQHPHRVADNLFMHEIAHMRHLGLLQQNGLGTAQRGNRWLVEGFARFAERLPIAARLLVTSTPARTANLVLPRNPAFNNAYFMDDVPTYLNAGSSMFFGYHTSAYVFDYFADQVALQGGDWLAALREVLIAAHSQATLDAVVQRWLPGSTFTDLFTRARIALYTDDIGTAGLPAWTQYHQFRLRESRPASSQTAAQDPRVQWQRVTTAVPVLITAGVASGAATGFVMAPASGDPAAVLRVTGPTGAHALLSLARIR